MPVDAQTAQAYFAQQPPAAQAQITASIAGNPNGILDWFQGAVNAGVPGAVSAAGGVATEAGWNKDGSAEGVRLPHANAAEPSEWMGKRKPTPSELRKWAEQQHQAYIGGDRSAQDEDYARFGDAVLADQIEKGWNVAGGWDKGWGTPGAGVPGQGGPTDPNNAGQGGGGQGQGQGGGSGGQPQRPGLFDPNNPLQNQLIQQFQNGAFGTNMGQVNNAASLSGGGVWSGMGGDFSQQFNPLKPRGGGGGQPKLGGGGGQPKLGGGGGGRGGGGRGGGGRGGGGGGMGVQGGGGQNPFQAASLASPTVTQPTGSAAWGTPNAPDPNAAPRNPMQNKLYNMYGGGNNSFSRNR